jgi:hypothetical protein
MVPEESEKIHHRVKAFWQPAIDSLNNLLRAGGAIRVHRVVHAQRGWETRFHLEKNWGSPFIVAFLILLLWAASFLIAGLASTATIVSTYAYYCLIVAVAFQFVCVFKYGEDKV